MTGKRILRTDYILYILIFAAFYMLNRFSFFITDDFYYAFIMQVGFPDNSSFVPIDSLADIWKSQCYAYFHHNGRFLVHSIVQLFCGILGMNVFVVFNSFMFVLLIAGITKCIRHYNGAYRFDIVLVTLLLFLTIPLFGKTYLGNISFAVNYLWTSCAVIWWYYFYISKKDANMVTNICLLFFSILVGSMQESFSIGVAGALGVYYLFNLKELKGTTAYLVLGFVLGSCVVILAPANFVRFASDPASSYTLKQQFLQMVRALLPLRMFWIMLLCVALLFVKKSRVECGVFLKKNAVLILASVTNIAFAAVVAMTGKHQLVSIELFSIVVVLSLLNNYCENLYAHESKLLLIFVIPLLALFVPIYMCRQSYYNAYQVLLSDARNANDGIIENSEYVRLCMGEPGWISERYAIRSQMSCGVNQRGLSLLLSNGKDDSIIKLILPDSQENIVNICVEENLVNDCVYKGKDTEYYVVRIRPCNLNEAKVLVYLQPGVMGRIIYKYVYQGVEVPDVKYTLPQSQMFNCDGYLYYAVLESSSIKTVAIGE